MSAEQSMGIKDDKAQEPQSASFPKAAPIPGAVAGSGALLSVPMISSECYDLAVLSVILAVLLLCAICGLCVHIRNAVLGARLLEACGGDRQSAVVAIESVKAETEFFDTALTTGLRAEDKDGDIEYLGNNNYRLRLARFNEDTE